MAKSKRPYLLPVTLTCDAAEIENGVSMELVDKYIGKHSDMLRRYDYLENLYRGFHDVYKEPEKESWKPDNRLAVNFPRYITDTFIGYAYGIPIKVGHPDDKVAESISDFEHDNEISDHDAELVKKCCIYGHTFEYAYQEDGTTRTRLTSFTPKELFVVYDDTVKSRALFAVRYGRHGVDSANSGKLYGEILTSERIEHFDAGAKTNEFPNPYGLIPVVEWRLNDERMGLFEPVAGLIEAYNHTIGEKANDVEAFAEAYLAVVGAELDEEGVYRIHDNRLINVYGTDNAKDVMIQFLQKPTADGTQENLLNRLEKLIYQIAMVANISDESFGNATSGTALAYKLQAMSNMALAFDRKIEKSIRKRYKLFCSLSTNAADPDSYRDIEITFSRNIPKNQKEEADTAQQLSGIVSHETQLKVLSVVEDPAAEIDRMKAEESSAQDSVLNRTMFTPKEDENG